MYTRLRGNLSLFSFIAALLVAGAGQAHAQASELERLQQCDRDLCSILRTPSTAGHPLQCDLSMTWYKDTIDKAAKAKGLIWPLGDAHCKAKVDIKRAVITRALTDTSYHMKVPDQAATCDVDYKGTLYPVKASVAPEIEFREGKATSVVLGIHNIEANTIVKALVWSAVKLQEKMGAYQDDMVRALNKYIETECRARPGKREAEVQPDGSKLLP
jgi:hypothetical protein